MLTHITGGLKFNLHAISGVCAELIQVHHTAVTDVSAALDLSAGLALASCTRVPVYLTLGPQACMDTKPG